MGKGRGGSSAGGEAPSADVDGLIDEVEGKLELASGAAERLQADLKAGRSCDADDLRLLTAYNQSFTEAREAIVGVDGGTADGEPETVEALRKAAASAAEKKRRAKEERAEVLWALRKLAESSDGGAGTDLLAPGRERARTLLDLEEIESEEDLRQAAGLAALVRLNEAGEGDEKDTLTAAAVDLLPEDCQPAVGMAAYGNLDLSPAGTATEEPVEAPEAPAPSPSAPPDDDTAEAPDADEASDADSASDADEAPPPSEEPPADEEVLATLDRLLCEGRFGLAHWIVAAWPAGGRGLENALEAVAYASVVRGPADESAARFRELIEAFPFETLHGDKAANLLALVAGLRATLLAPYSGAGDLLGAVAPAFSRPPGLASLIDAVVSAGQRGLSAPAMTDRVQGIVSAEDSLAAVQARAEQVLKLSTIKYARATNVWRKWIEPEGVFGSLLRAVVENRTDELGEIEQRVFKLRGARALERQVDETDRLLKAANRQRQIVADARQKLIERAEESLTVVADWVEVSRELESVRSREAEENWQMNLLEDVRTAARESREEVNAAWERWSGGDDLRAAAAVGTAPMLAEIFDLLVDGVKPQGADGEPDEVLGLELLRVAGLDLGPRLEPRGELPLGPLLAAATSEGWEPAFGDRVEEANFDAAERIVEVVRGEDPELAETLERRRLERRDDEVGHLQARLDDAGRRLGAARREGRISDADGMSLTNRHSAMAIEEDRQDFRGLDAALDAFQADLKRAEAEGERRAREIYLPRLEEDRRLGPHRERLQRLLERGEVSTLEELVLAIERDEEPPEEEDRIFRQLTEFFPATVADKKVATAAADAEGLEAAIAARERFGALDFASLKEEEIEPVQAAVAAWRRLDSGDFSAAEEDLVLVLDLIGLTIEQGPDAKLAKKRRTDKRSSGEMVAKPLGKALIPAFGSDARNGKYRLRMIWERMSDEAIAALLSQEDGKQPIVMLCFGAPLAENVRRGLADQLRHQKNRRAVALVDGPAFLYLASKGGRNLATTMRITAPFSAVNPYTPFVAGSVPLEMFYGRDRELAEVIDPGGTCFIYGGRRLGKSALLRAAQRKFNGEGPNSRALYVDLKGIGELEPAGAVIGEIARALKNDGLMTMGGAREPTFEEIRTQVKAWLEIDGERRILLLLDECDSFLNADAREGFRNVSELKTLMDETERRFKPVFAGLHQVRRFQRIPNQPLAHLGYPTPVGPLKPQPAYDLIVKPLEALGFKFETADLPTRILTATNYQPSLIQLFCSELVEYMLREKSCGPDSPPYLVASADVEHVYHTPRVVEEMRTRFELTTNLDPRYRVIANSVAFEALGADLSVGLSASEIRAICDEYWPAGFAKTGTDEFRALLEELDSLGVLFEDQDGRFLVRSPNVLRMLGTAEQIEEHLNASSELELPQGFEATTFRGSLGGDEYRRRPFTHQQVASLRGEDSEDSLLRVVVGSPATGIDDVMGCLGELFEDGTSRFNYKDVSAHDRKRLLARFNRPAKKKRRVVAYRPKANVPWNELLTLIEKVGDKISDPEAHSTVVFVLDTGHLPAWQALVAPDAPIGEAYIGGAMGRFELIELKRWSKAGLRAWAQAQDVDLFFNADAPLNELIRVTGGWPALVDRVVAAYVERRDWRRALGGVEQWLETPEGARALCDSIGLLADERLAAAWNLFTVYGEPIAQEEFQALAEDSGVEDPGRAAEALRSMQVLELDASGRYVVEETATRAWASTRLALSDAAT